MPAHHSIRWFPVALGILLAGAGCATGTKGETPHSAEKTTNQPGNAIISAYEQGNASAWRLAMLKEAEAFRGMSARELANALSGYRKLAAQRGVAGLEAILLAGAAELASRGHAGQVMVETYLKMLAAASRPTAAKDRPNAYVPVVRPKSPVAHFLPLETVRGALATQVKTKATDPDDVVTRDACSEEARAAYEARWGHERAEQLRKLCEGRARGPAQGGTGPGIVAGLSVVDCLIATQEPSRADQLTAMTQACLASNLAGNGNPFAAGEQHWPLTHPFRLTPADEHGRQADPDRTDRFPANGPPYEHITTYDASGVPVERLSYAGDEITRTQYNEQGELEFKETVTTENGYVEPVRAEAYEGGVLAESVDYNDDRGYTVRRYDGEGQVTYEQRYDSDGRPVGGDGETADAEEAAEGSAGSAPSDPDPHTPPADGDGEGFNTPECRAMNLFLLGERMVADLERKGIDPRVANYDPDDPQHYGVAEDLQCLGMLDLGTDAALHCNQLVNCPLGQLPNESCACQPLQATTLPSRGCEYVVTCANGVPATESNGQCVCGEAEKIFVDPVTGGGPLPDNPFFRR